MSYKNKIRSSRDWYLGLIILTSLSLIANLYKITTDQKSEYYAAVVKSMSLNFKNYFFGAMDPAGIISVDKIPGSFWVPALFVHFFGFNQWTLIAPNAIACSIAAVVVALTTKKYFGVSTGLIAGFIVASCPILIAVSRSNQPESIFLLLLSIVANRVLHALHTGSRRSLIVAGIWIALAFQSYMIITWAIWPAVMFAWLISKKELRKKINDLLIAGSISLLFSISWIAIVFVTPKSNRPYVGGSLHNNPFEMVFGYNGLGRFETITQNQKLESFGFKVFTPTFGGHTGVLRLFNLQLLGQIGWLIPATLVSTFLLYSYKKRSPIVIFYTTWFITLFVIFSTVKGLHQFYTASLILSIGPIFAIAIKEFSTSKEILVVLLIVPTLTSMLISYRYQPYEIFLPIIQFAFTVIVISALYMKEPRRRNIAILIFLIPCLIFTPAAWGFETRSYMAGLNPIAGPAEFGQIVAGPSTALHERLVKSGIESVAQDRLNETRLLRYVESKDPSSKYLFAIDTANAAAPFINLTSRNILPLGGFQGQDPVPTLEQFLTLIQSKELKYFVSTRGELTKALPNTPSEKSNISAIESWVFDNCSVDPEARFSEVIYRCY